MCTRAVSVRIAAVLISWKKVHKQTNITMYVIATYSSTAIFLMTLLIYCQEQQSFVLVMHLTLTGPSLSDETFTGCMCRYMHRMYKFICTKILRYSFAVSDTKMKRSDTKTCFIHLIYLKADNGPCQALTCPYLRTSCSNKNTFTYMYKFVCRVDLSEMLNCRQLGSGISCVSKLTLNWGWSSSSNSTVSSMNPWYNSGFTTSCVLFEYTATRNNIK